MKPLFIHYPKCGTCIKAAKWLKENHIEFTPRDIVADNPSRDELAAWLPLTGLPVQKLFNTSGLRYKELNLKERVKTASEAELLDLLATEGKLIKRPLLVLPDKVLVGFNEQTWESALL